MERVMNRIQNVKSKLLKLGDVLWTTFCEFCESSSINGVRYITEQRLHWSERIWWIIAIGVSLWMCSTMIVDTWQDWRDNLTILNVEENSLISAIPFPTVTICPFMKSTKDKFDLDALFGGSRTIDTSRLSERDNERLNTLAHICKSISANYQFQGDYTNESIYDIVEDVAPKLQHILDECRWQGKRFDCSKYFVPVFTTYGLCFSFNALNSVDVYTDAVTPNLMNIKNNPNTSDFEQESEFLDTSIDNSYPLRAAEAGPNAGLVVSLAVRNQDYTSRCNINEKDYVLILSVPGGSKETYAIVYQLSTSTDSLVSMEPELTTTSDALRSYSEIERGCVYRSERPLAFFKSYSLSNCATECVSNYTLARCGCVPFHLPRFENTKICGAAKIKCYKQAYLQVRPKRGKCNCKVACSSINYFTSFDAVKFNQTALSELKGANYSGLTMTKMSVFFKDLKLKRIKRMETNTFADFLAVCGGLLGLFLGITALSIIEIVYYLSLRLFWNVRNSTSSEDSMVPTNTEMRHHSNDQFDGESEVKLTHAMQTTLFEFCKDGCIHGVKYLTEKGLHWIERFCFASLYAFSWSVAIISSFGVCGYLIRNIWMEWNDNPATMIRSEIDLGPLTFRQIPYPTITICPERKTSKHKFDLSSALRNVSNLSDVE